MAPKVSRWVHIFITTCNILFSYVWASPGENGTYHMSRLMTKPTMWLCTQRRLKISLGILPVWSESSLCTQWVAKDLTFLHAHSGEDSDQTGPMPRLIWVFAGRTCHFIGFVTRWLIWVTVKAQVSLHIQSLLCSHTICGTKERLRHRDTSLTLYSG